MNGRRSSTTRAVYTPTPAVAYARGTPGFVAKDGTSNQNLIRCSQGLLQAAGLTCRKEAAPTSLLFTINVHIVADLSLVEFHACPLCQEQLVSATVAALERESPGDMFQAAVGDAQVPEASLHRDAIAVTLITIVENVSTTLKDESFMLVSAALSRAMTEGTLQETLRNGGGKVYLEAFVLGDEYVPPPLSSAQIVNTRELELVVRSMSVMESINDFTVSAATAVGVGAASPVVVWAVGAALSA